MTTMRVNPNRMELIRLGRRLALARRGHSLLKDKQDDLMERFTDSVKKVREIRRGLEERYAQLREPYMRASYNSSSAALESYRQRPPIQTKITGSYTRLMNLRIPELHAEFEDGTDTLGAAVLSAALPDFLRKFKEVAAMAVELSNAERKMYMIAEELQKVRRRVNALEHIYIPRLKETISYITMQLEEMERENITRLMKVKDIVRKSR